MWECVLVWLGVMFLASIMFSTTHLYYFGQNSITTKHTSAKCPCSRFNLKQLKTYSVNPFFISGTQCWWWTQPGHVIHAWMTLIKWFMATLTMTSNGPVWHNPYQSYMFWCPSVSSARSWMWYRHYTSCVLHS